MDKNISIKEISFHNYIKKFKNGNLKSTIFINNCYKLFYDIVLNETLKFKGISFINRLWIILNDLKDIPLCPYCNNQCKFSENIFTGYYRTCENKKCKNEDNISFNTKYKKFKNSDILEFIKKQNTIKQFKITDQLIIDLFFYKNKGLKHHLIEYIKEPLKTWIEKRFNDSSSIEETLLRINKKIYKKPKCLYCGNPVNYIGKPSHMFSEYCSNSCAAKGRTSNKNKNQKS